MNALSRTRPRHRCSPAVILAACLSLAANDFATAQVRLSLGSAVQAGDSAARLVVDGDETPWPSSVPVYSDSVAVVARILLSDFSARGYWLARLDSVVVASRSTTFHVTKGAPARVRSFAMDGLSVVDTSDARRTFTLRAGAVADQKRLVDDTRRLLRDYAIRGYPLASATIVMSPRDGQLPLDAEIEEVGGGHNGVDIRVLLQEGMRVVLDSVNLDARVRTSPKLVAQLAGLKIGGAVTTFDPDEVRTRLEASGLFASVGEVRLEADNRGLATLTVPLVENPPGNFDLVLGYQSQQGGGGNVVGNGHIKLHNIFGGAREISMALNRISGGASNLDAAIYDPHVVGSIVGVSLAFAGEQRDSTYNKQSYAAEVLYQVSDRIVAAVSGARDVTRPGQAGLAVVGGRQRIPRSSGLFGGLRVTYSSLDRPTNPTSGLLASTAVERGTKRVTAYRVVGNDTLSQSEGLRQERFTIYGRAYLSVLPWQVVAIGADAAALVSDEYDEADLLRLGGASSLRGYIEEQFYGRFVGRGLIEYRFLLDRSSYVFGFLDIGYVEAASRESATGPRSYHPGFGFGIQFATAVGLVNATYGMNPDDGPLNGKIHVGLSFAL